MLEGKIAVVTVNAEGIGISSSGLAGEGATVVINYNGSKEKAEEVKQEIEGAGGKAAVCQCNVADFDQCQAFIQKVIDEFGRIDILVNNAGITGTVF